MKADLFIYWHSEKITLFLSDKSGDRKMSVFTTADSDELIKSQISRFVAGAVIDTSLLLIPRSEVLQRKMMLSRTGSGLSELETSLEQILPYAPKDMAYSIVMDEAASRAVSTNALLYAIPDQKIKEIITRLQKAGLAVDEVVSEDQALFWLFQNKMTDGNALMVDVTSDRTLILAMNKNSICLSNTYPSQDDVKTVIQEMSFSLLEAGVKISSAVVCGQVNKIEIASVLGVPVEAYADEIVGEVVVPPVIVGAQMRGDRAAISLLPSSQKIQNKLKAENKRLRSVLFSLAIFILCCTGLNLSHWMILAHKKDLLLQESKKISASVLEVKKIRSDLDAIKNAKHSKKRLLYFLKNMAEQIPAAVRVKQIQVDDPSIVFQGESPSHALLTQAVQEMEKMGELQEVKLEHARLRKKLNQDYFEFEITARWRS